MNSVLIANSLLPVTAPEFSPPRLSFSKYFFCSPTFSIRITRLGPERKYNSESQK